MEAANINMKYLSFVVSKRYFLCFKQVIHQNILDYSFNRLVTNKRINVELVVRSLFSWLAIVLIEGQTKQMSRILVVINVIFKEHLKGKLFISMHPAVKCLYLLRAF